MINQQTNPMNFISTTAQMAPTLTNTEWLRTMALGTDAIAKEAYAKLTEMVNEQGYPFDDIRDFIDTYDYEAFVEGHYETWEQITEELGVSNEAIEAFVEEFGINRIDGFEDSYQGAYRDGAEFARELVEGGWDIDNIPGFIEIDWEATWQNLSDDYTEIDGYVFNNHF